MRAHAVNTFAASHEPEAPSASVRSPAARQRKARSVANRLHAAPAKPTDETRRHERDVPQTNSSVARTAKATAMQTVVENAFPAKSDKSRSEKARNSATASPHLSPWRAIFSRPVSSRPRDVDQMRPFGHKHGQTERP